jgi:hypothetical protein
MLELNEYQLKIEIEMKRGQSPYSYWIIGVTDDPTRRRGEHDAEEKNTKYWHSWKADSEIIARSVEEWFLGKGMKGGMGEGAKPTFVYIF